MNRPRASLLLSAPVASALGLATGFGTAVEHPGITVFNAVDIS